MARRSRSTRVPPTPSRRCPDSAPIFAAEDVIQESAIEFEHEAEDTEEVVDKFKAFLDEVTPEDFASGLASSAGAPAPCPAPASRDLERNSGCLCGLGKQTGLGEPGNRLRLEHLAAAVLRRIMSMRAKP